MPKATPEISEIRVVRIFLWLAVSDIELVASIIGSAGSGFGCSAELLPKLDIEYFRSQGTSLVTLA